MSHVFISYAHQDKPHLDRLVAWLHDNGFREPWYDDQIAGGNNWRDEIATALDEAFAVVVIVTSNSVKSQYCTYEWAYAMGQGIQTFPLVFDAVSMSDVPTPLTSRQFTNCTESIPGFLKEQLNRLKTVPPQVAAINKVVYDAIYDTHRRFYILRWIGEGLGSSSGLSEIILEYFAIEAFKAHRVLESLMIEKAFALSGKQYRLCWQLADMLESFSNIQIQDNEYLPNHLSSQFESLWLPAFEYFDDDGWWRKAIKPHFEWDLEDENNRMSVFAEMMRVFPMVDTPDMDLLIHNHRSDEERKTND